MADLAFTLDLDRYLPALGLERPPAPSLASLAELQRRHNARFPFETITTLLREPVMIEPATVQRKLLDEGRGGYCYELNGAFLRLLQGLGFSARAIAARVLMGATDDTPAARTHMLALVTIEGVEYIADTGFGGMTPTGPLRLDRRTAQRTPHEEFRLDVQGDAYTLLSEVAGEWRPMYRFDLQVQESIDHVVGNWYVCTHPDSSFPGQLRAALSGPGWRRTLGNGSFAIHRAGQPSERRELTGVDDVLRVLEQEFGIRVPPHPGLREALAIWLTARR